jgi:hypothetical protein
VLTRPAAMTARRESEVKRAMLFLKKKQQKNFCSTGPRS